MASQSKLKFEDLPGEIRVMIYRLLLIDDEDAEGIETLDMTELDPSILRTNKKIHDEAAAILYGENFFSWHLRGDRPRKLWHWGSRLDGTYIPRRYSRLMTKVHLHVTFVGVSSDPSDQAVMNAFYQLQENIAHACGKLALNDLTKLKISYVNVYRRRLEGRRDVGEDCLEILMKLRSSKLQVCGDVSQVMRARLKASIEGPKDAIFFAERERKEKESESDFEDSEEAEDDWY